MASALVAKLAGAFVRQLTKPISQQMVMRAAHRPHYRSALAAFGGSVHRMKGSLNAVMTPVSSQTAVLVERCYVRVDPFAMAPAFGPHWVYAPSNPKNQSKAADGHLDFADGAASAVTEASASAVKPAASSPAAVSMLGLVDMPLADEHSAQARFGSKVLSAGTLIHPDSSHIHVCGWYAVQIRGKPSVSVEEELEAAMRFQGVKKKEAVVWIRPVSTEWQDDELGGGFQWRSQVNVAPSAYGPIADTFWSFFPLVYQRKAAPWGPAFRAPLKEERAMDEGATFAAEVIVYVVGATLITEEYLRAQRKEQVKVQAKDDRRVAKREQAARERAELQADNARLSGDVDRLSAAVTSLTTTVDRLLLLQEREAEPCKTQIR